MNPFSMRGQTRLAPQWAMRTQHATQWASTDTTLTQWVTTGQDTAGRHKQMEFDVAVIVREMRPHHSQSIPHRFFRMTLEL